MSGISLLSKQSVQTIKGLGDKSNCPWVTGSHSSHNYYIVLPMQARHNRYVIRIFYSGVLSLLTFDVYDSVPSKYLVVVSGSPKQT